MGTQIGHLLPGIAFLALGLWHLINHIKLYSLQPNSYTSFPWFPTSKIRYLELFFIILGSSISISMELFIGPARHQPFDTDGTIPSYHLRNFEHASISMFFFVYASFAILLDKIKPKAHHDITQLVGAMAFCQQFLLFHLHSTNHKGLDGHYHLLLKVIVFVCIATTLMGIGFPRSFLVSFVRSVSIVFEGVWFIVMGFMLWTAELMPKGCMLHNDDGPLVVICDRQEALHRAKSLVNILFSWFLIGITIFSISFYLGFGELYRKSVQYCSLAKEFEDLKEESIDVESQKEMGALIHVEQRFTTFDMERLKM